MENSLILINPLSLNWRKLSYLLDQKYLDSNNHSCQEYTLLKPRSSCLRMSFVDFNLSTTY